MNYLTELEPYDLNTNGSNLKTLRVLVEISKGSIHKYEYNPSGYMTIVRDLHSNYKYPYNYGCVPRTLAGDNDPLDVILFSDEPIAIGTVVNCNVLGIIKTIDNGEEDDKLLCVPYYIKTGTIDLKKTLKYLKNYKFPFQAGTEIKEVCNKPIAEEIISSAIQRYKEVCSE